MWIEEQFLQETSSLDKKGFGKSSNQRSKNSSALDCGYKVRVNWQGRDFTKASAYRKTRPFQGMK